jgi:competence ComEA-like helix-hairpin-helix protein
MKKIKFFFGYTFVLFLIISNYYFYINYNKYKKELNYIEKSNNNFESADIEINYNDLSYTDEKEQFQIQDKIRYDINNVTYEQLLNIKEIDPQISKAIIQYRDSTGKFYTLDELKNITGIGNNVFETLKKYVTLEGKTDPFVKKYKTEKYFKNLDGKININAAGIELISSISGVGEKTAQRIIDFREQNRGFKDLKALTQVKRVGDSLIEKIQDQIYVGPYRKLEFNPEYYKIHKFNLNTITYVQLRQLPYIDIETANSIIKHLQDKGKFSELRELRNVKGLSYSVYFRIKDFFYVK